MIKRDKCPPHRTFLQRTGCGKDFFPIKSLLATKLSLSGRNGRLSGWLGGGGGETEEAADFFDRYPCRFTKSPLASPLLTSVTIQSTHKVKWGALPLYLHWPWDNSTNNNNNENNSGNTHNTQQFSRGWNFFLSPSPSLAFIQFCINIEWINIHKLNAGRHINYYTRSSSVCLNNSSNQTSEHTGFEKRGGMGWGVFWKVELGVVAEINDEGETGRHWLGDSRGHSIPRQIRFLGYQ